MLDKKTSRGCDRGGEDDEGTHQRKRKDKGPTFIYNKVKTKKQRYNG